MNDNTVLGGIRATEGQGFKSRKCSWDWHQWCGCAVNELSKPVQQDSRFIITKSGRTLLNVVQKMLAQMGENGVEPEKIHCSSRCCFL